MTRIARGVTTLQKGGDIGDVEVKAADRYVREFEAGAAKMRTAKLGEIRGSGGSDGFTQFRLDALRSVRMVRDALGAGSEIRLRLLLIEDYSFSKMAETLNPGRPNANMHLQGQAALLLQQLANHYRTRQQPKG